MDRPSLRLAVVAAVLLSAVSISLSSGCRSTIATAMYLIKGNEVDPDYTGLKGKKVVVVCRPPAEQQYSSSNVGTDVAQQMCKLMQEKVPKIKVVDAQKVAKWCEDNKWEEFTEVGKAMKADMVVGVDLHKFSIYQGQTLYQGKANSSVKVYDCKDGGKVVFEKILPQTVYPPNTFIQTSDIQEEEFRREFVGILADQIARYFYSHDPMADLGQDGSALR
jgi:ABC-type uncharacterized transport system auxiliary subunit